MAVISDPKLKAIIEAKISNNFGLSLNTVAEKCRHYGRFKAYLSSDLEATKRVLQIVKDNGVSYTFFAAYERSEGYNSKWGWLNHTTKQGTAYTDADSVARWLLSQSKKTSDNPAWIDYANYKDFVPSATKKAGNAHFKSLAKGTIGRVLIAGTAAATWGVYYPNGLLASYNGIQNYANPFDVVVNTIDEWGGKLDGSESPDPDPDPDPTPKPPPQPEEEKEEVKDIDYYLDFIQAMGVEIKKGIEQILTVNVYDYGNSQTRGNQYLKIMKTYNNMVKIKPNLEFDKFFNTLIKKAMSNVRGKLSEVLPKDEEVIIDDDPPPTEPVEPPKPDDEEKEPEEPNETNNNKVFPVRYKLDGINFFKRVNHKTGSVQRDMTWGIRSWGVFHSGYDIGTAGHANYGAYAMRDCEIIFVGYYNGGGYAVQMKHLTDDYYTMFLHLKEGSIRVKKGQKVKCGTRIATVGATGGNYPIHLHIEVSKTGKFHTKANTMNPENYLGITADNKTSLKSP